MIKNCVTLVLQWYNIEYETEIGRSPDFRDVTTKVGKIRKIGSLWARNCKIK